MVSEGGNGSRDTIGALQTVAERNLQHGQDTHVHFEDYKNAFKAVDWKKLMNSLRRSGLEEWNEGDMRRTKNDVTRLNDKGGLQQIGEGRTMQQMAPLKTENQKNKKKI